MLVWLYGKAWFRRSRFYRAKRDPYNLARGFSSDEEFDAWLLGEEPRP
jgi:hypothetical protein